MYIAFWLLWKACWRAISPTTVLPAPVGAQTITFLPERISPPAFVCPVDGLRDNVMMMMGLVICNSFWSLECS